MGRSVQLLTALHRRPGITRAAAARELGLSSGLAADLGARLAAESLLSERPAAPSGSRGRPTTMLAAHPEGPLAVCVSIEDATWRVAAIELGGTVVRQTDGTHAKNPDDLLPQLRRQILALQRRFGRRVQAVAAAVPGTVRDEFVLQAPGLGWRDVNLSKLALSGLPLRTGNDATFSAVAEARRGVAADLPSSLHLYLDAGAGGALIERGQVVPGATGQSGEFGHLPMGVPGQRCGCGALGCWNTALDGLAMARRLGRRPPADQARFARQVLDRARTPGPARAAIVEVATSLGRGIAGLVNALDPALVSLGGIGPNILEVGGPALSIAYATGLMEFRRTDPPPIVAARIGPDAPLFGAADVAFDRILTDEGLAAWSGR